MSIGLILLVVVAILVFLGLAHRVLDRMNLSDRGALLFIGAMVLGTFLPPIPLLRGEASVSLNVGGALVPLALVIYLLSRASGTEIVRALLAAAVTAGVTYGISQFTEFDPGQTFIDSVWLFGILAGVVAYGLGRSRRAAFVGGVLGILLNDVVEAIRAAAAGLRSDVFIGGAGALDAVVLAGFIGVMLAELLGETWERLGGGPAHDKDRPMALDNEEYRREEFGDELGRINSHETESQDGEGR